MVSHPPLFKRIPTYRRRQWRKKKERTKTNVVSNTVFRQPHHINSTLQRRGNGRFHVVSTWKTYGVFVELHVKGSYSRCWIYQSSQIKLYLETVNNKILSIFRSSRQEVFCKKKCSYRNFIKFAGKHLCQSLFFNKVADLRSGNFLWILWNF